MIKSAGAAAACMEYEERAADLHERTVLSRREAEVYALKELGLSHQEVGDELGIAKNTVDEYSRRIREARQEARATIDELGEVEE